MNFGKIQKYVIMAKQLLASKEKNGNIDDEDSQQLIKQMDHAWNNMTDEETLMVDHIFQFEATTKSITGEWMDNEWFMPEKE